MHNITKKQFDAFCYVRQPMIRHMSKEIEWYSNDDRTALATLILDRIDKDYGTIILGRDSRNIFRCIDISSEFFPDVESARNDLKKLLNQYENDGKSNYPQGDEKTPPNDILIPVVSENQLHPYFKALINMPHYDAARNIIKEIANSFVDVDGNYIKEFQTHGFDARLWELYLYVYLYNEGFEFIREHTAPDFHISFYGEETLIEAVTVNPSENPARPDEPMPDNSEETSRLIMDYMPIKFGSSLYSKLQKKYWEKDHVKKKPLILAIHDFHQTASMTWSRTALMNYLYGKRVRVGTNDQGATDFIMEDINKHSWKDKEIPSNFFGYENAEYISAVLFNNAATIAKFNRMGKLAGLGGEKLKMLRQGFIYNPEPMAQTPIPFQMDVDSPDYEESWSDSLVMLHNPNAIYPVDPENFYNISHFFYNEKDGFVGEIQPFDVLSSVTIVINPVPDEEIDDLND